MASRVVSVMKRHPQITFFVLAYAVAWGFVPFGSFGAPSSYLISSRKTSLCLKPAGALGDTACTRPGFWGARCASGLARALTPLLIDSGSGRPRTPLSRGRCC